MLILALDALDLNPIVKYKCRFLKQTQHGQTDVSDFKLLRTVVLWAAFLSGKNMEEEIPMDTESQWKFTLEPEKTFLSFFETYKAIDLPAFSLKQNNHLKERRLMKEFFDNGATFEDFEGVVWNNHEENKKDFFKSLDRYDLVLGYFDLADAIGHLGFGIPKIMKEIYLELEELAKEVKTSIDDSILIISDHGMKQVGRYGEHSENGFYSINRKLDYNNPKITDFYNLIEKIARNFHATK